MTLSTDRSSTAQRGFTLIEIMISVAIIAILASIGAPLYNAGLKSAKKSTVVAQMKGIIRDIDMYRLANGLKLPLTLAEIGADKRRDPWGRPYYYLNFATGTASPPGQGNGKGKGKGGGGSGKGSGKGNGKGSGKGNGKGSGKGNGKSSGNGNAGGQGSSGNGPGGGGGNGKKRKDKNLVPLNTDYDLYSMGPDGKSVSPLTAKASRDDIVRANDGAFIGTAIDY